MDEATQQVNGCKRPRRLLTGTGRHRPWPYCSVMRLMLVPSAPCSRTLTPLLTRFFTGDVDARDRNTRIDIASKNLVKSGVKVRLQGVRTADDTSISRITLQ